MQEFALEWSLWKRVFWELIESYLTSRPTWLICCLVQTCSYFIFHLIQRFQTFGWDPKRVHCLSHFHNVVDLVDLVDSFLCSRGHHASMTKGKDSLCSIIALNQTEMQVLKIFVGVFAALWVCHGLHLQGTQTPDVWDLFHWVCLRAKSIPAPVPVWANFPKNIWVESFCTELVELIMHCTHWKQNNSGGKWNTFQLLTRVARH